MGEKSSYKLDDLLKKIEAFEDYFEDEDIEEFYESLHYQQKYKDYLKQQNCLNVSLCDSLWIHLSGG